MAFQVPSAPELATFGVNWHRSSELTVDSRSGPSKAPLPDLLGTNGVVLAETYPGLAYAAALAEELPTGRFVVGKTRYQARNDACNRLSDATWVKAYGATISDLEQARADEDDFDALFTAAAVLRCVLEDTPLANADWIDNLAEGAMLLAGPVDSDS